MYMCLHVIKKQIFMEGLFTLYRCLITTLHGMNKVALIEALQCIVTSTLVSCPALTLSRPPVKEPRYEATTTLEQIPTHQSNYTVSQPSHQTSKTTSYLTCSVAENDVCYVIDGVLSLVDQLVRFPAELHDVPCADAHLVELSKYIIVYDEWKEVAPFLCLSPEEVKEIVKAFPRVNRFSKATAQAEASPEAKMLRKWGSKFGKNANYR